MTSSVIVDGAAIVHLLQKTLILCLRDFHYLATSCLDLGIEQSVEKEYVRRRVVEFQGIGMTYFFMLTETKLSFSTSCPRLC